MDNSELLIFGGYLLFAWAISPWVAFHVILLDTDRQRIAEKDPTTLQGLLGCCLAMPIILPFLLIILSVGGIFAAIVLVGAVIVLVGAVCVDVITTITKTPRTTIAELVGSIAQSKPTFNLLRLIRRN